LNGCSTSAPRSSAAKQWFEQLAQKKKKNQCDVFFHSFKAHFWCGMYLIVATMVQCATLSVEN